MGKRLVPYGNNKIELQVIRFYVKCHCSLKCKLSEYASFMFIDSKGVVSYSGTIIFYLIYIQSFYE
jgi:hypothetical protein